MVDSQTHGSYKLSFSYLNLAKSPHSTKKNCLGKTMERVVDKRLVWYTEYNKLISNTQCSFRSQRSTMDHIVRLETSIRETNIKKQYHIAVFPTERRHTKPIRNMVYWKTDITWSFEADCPISSRTSPVSESDQPGQNFKSTRESPSREYTVGDLLQPKYKYHFQVP